MIRHIQRMNKVVQFIDETLDKDVSISQLAKMAFYSEYHFYRLFRFYVGESVYAYRKRLMLERAVKFLQFSDKAVTEIAFASGYDNHSSFTKAFKKHFNYSPTEVRKEKMVFDKYEFPSIDEGFKMKVEIIEINNIHVIAARGVGDYNEVAAQAWGTLMPFAYGNGHMQGDVRRFGISHDDPNVTDLDKIRYDACLQLDVDISGAIGIKKMVIAGGKYAKVMHKGSYDELDKIYNYLFNNWLPDSGYELRIAPPFDLYHNKDPRRTKPENLRTEVFIPLE